ncbi:hypothetical protein [Piscirickettsia litoralis]|uniref:hypothetical protein n=1 Tax=Piscirickettsia litoralis TaxID=1891921 RepID=UPI001F3C9237|nr:hypothetical protein [Piscirickettsia litoralis]
MKKLIEFCSAVFYVLVLTYSHAWAMAPVETLTPTVLPNAKKMPYQHQTMKKNQNRAKY